MKITSKTILVESESGDTFQMSTVELPEVLAQMVVLEMGGAKVQISVGSFLELLEEVKT